jgi:H/ACA ribonucleoprotein complex subunit 2
VVCIAAEVILDCVLEERYIRHRVQSCSVGWPINRAHAGSMWGRESLSPFLLRTSGNDLPRHTNPAELSSLHSSCVALIQSNSLAMSEVTPKKEKKDKKRKSEAAVEPEAIAPVEGSASAEAVAMEVDGDKAAKKAKKDKKEKRKSIAGEGEDADDKKVSHYLPFKSVLRLILAITLTQAEFYVPPEAISPISSPLAPRKLQKKLFKTVKRASKARQLKRGVKEVVKSLRKGDKGLLLLASNITPVDVVSHLPVMAEEAQGVEYCWVLSK